MGLHRVVSIAKRRLGYDHLQELISSWVIPYTTSLFQKSHGIITHCCSQYRYDNINVLILSVCISICSYTANYLSSKRPTLRPLTYICGKNSKNYDWKIRYSILEYTLVQPNSIFCVVHFFKGFLNDFRIAVCQLCARTVIYLLLHTGSCLLQIQQSIYFLSRLMRA
jgi:hypothetical protein